MPGVDVTEHTPDTLVGLPQLADILGRSPKALQKWRAAGNRVLPDTELVVNARPTLIWRLSYVLGRLWGRGLYDGPIPDPMPLPDVVGMAWICDRTGLKPRSVQAWPAEAKRRERLGLAPDPDPFPEPVYRVGDVPLFDRGDMESWLVRRGKITDGEEVPL